MSAKISPIRAPFPLPISEAVQTLTKKEGDLSATQATAPPKFKLKLRPPLEKRQIWPLLRIKPFRLFFPLRQRIALIKSKTLATKSFYAWQSAQRGHALALPRFKATKPKTAPLSVPLPLEKNSLIGLEACQTFFKDWLVENLFNEINAHSELTVGALYSKLLEKIKIKAEEFKATHAPISLCTSETDKSSEELHEALTSLAAFRTIGRPIHYSLLRLSVISFFQNIQNYIELRNPKNELPSQGPDLTLPKVFSVKQKNSFRTLLDTLEMPFLVANLNRPLSSCSFNSSLSESSAWKTLPIQKNSCK